MRHTERNRLCACASWLCHGWRKRPRQRGEGSHLASRASLLQQWASISRLCSPPSKQHIARTWSSSADSEIKTCKNVHPTLLLDSASADKIRGCQDRNRRCNSMVVLLLPRECRARLNQNHSGPSNQAVCSSPLLSSSRSAPLRGLHRLGKQDPLTAAVDSLHGIKDGLQTVHNEEPSLFKCSEVVLRGAGSFERPRHARAESLCEMSFSHAAHLASQVRRKAGRC